MEKIRIALVEDQQLFRQSLSALIRTMDTCVLVAEAADATSFLEMLKNTGALPDIVLIDLNLPGLTGIELNEILRQQYPSIRLIVLSVYSGERLISKMINAGACAYLSKNCDASELVTAITTVHQAGFYINTATLVAIQRASASRNKTIRSMDSIPIDLTKREKEILRLICREFNNAEIAEQLYLSVRTVEGHRNNLLLKTGCRNTAGLVLFAVKYSIFEVVY
jgi:DNA-binding NarL/FixJ family response regulator